MALNILYSLWFLILAVGVLGLIRNDWTYRQRIAVLNIMPIGTGLRAYKMLPSYYTMASKVWLWDVADFVNPENRAEFRRLTGK